MTAARLEPIRILLVDDHTLMRAGLETLIAQRPGLQVVGEAANRVQAVAMASAEQPDIILLDLDLGSENSIDFLPELLATAPNARVILLTGLNNPELHRRAVHLGAMGLVLKEEATAVLVKAIEKVYAGEIWLNRTMVASVLGERSKAKEQVDPEQAKIATLTPRERDVIALIAEGLTNKQIADRLFVSEATVGHHLGSIFNKLGVANRLQLVVYAYKHGLAKA